MWQHIFQTILILFMLAGLSNSYPVAPRELIKNGPDSVVAFEGKAVEPSTLTPSESEPKEMFYKDIGRREAENSQGRKFVQYQPEPGEITRGETRERETDDIEVNVDTERCPNKMYGVKCTMPCPVNCQGNCNRSTGYCSGCKDKGHYGNLCEMICEQCNNLSCYFFDGTCIEGENATYIKMNSITDRPMKHIDDKIKVGPFDANALVSGEVTRKGFLREQAIGNSKEIQDIEDDHDPLDQWYFNMNVRVFNRTSTYLFRNFTSKAFLIFLMSVLIIVAIVGMYVISKHSPGAI